MHIETIEIERLQPYPRNARTHSPEQIREIAKSIERFGFCNPVLVGDNNDVIAGHGRIAAAKFLGLKTVPTVKLSHLSEAERRAYILADNKLAEKAGWDKEILAIEIQGLIDLDFDVTVTGFSTGEIDCILTDDASDSPDPADTIPARQIAVSQVGDCWVLGRHRLLCGDARSSSSYQTLLRGARAQYVFTDPPYNVKIDRHVCGRGKAHHPDFKMASGEMSQAEFTKFLTDVFQLLAAHSEDGSIHQICMDWRHLREMLDAGYCSYNELKNLCVWNKSNWGLGNFYRSKHELIFVWKNGTAPHINNMGLGQFGRTRSNVWDYPGANVPTENRSNELAMHPTVKPVALVADAIKDCSHRGGLVLDPFTGSGSTMIAAQETGREFRGIEIDPVYVDVAVRRWQDYTGQSAVLEASHQAFDMVVRERMEAVSC
jgi:DNA modification methylase